ncbi:hypothetical protein C8R44DRAFT_882456 [Mycena epipterygia]|nr:hypothetical protein C8R44DRAFT_882456 [Mycena epipterygia]
MRLSLFRATVLALAHTGVSFSINLETLAAVPGNTYILQWSGDPADNPGAVGLELTKDDEPLINEPYLDKRTVERHCFGAVPGVVAGIGHKFYPCLFTPRTTYLIFLLNTYHFFAYDDDSGFGLEGNPSGATPGVIAESNRFVITSPA